MNLGIILAAYVLIGVIIHLGFNLIDTSKFKKQIYPVIRQTDRQKYRHIINTFKILNPDIILSTENYYFIYLCVQNKNMDYWDIEKIFKGSK